MLDESNRIFNTFIKNLTIILSALSQAQVDSTKLILTLSYS